MKHGVRDVKQVLGDMPCLCQRCARFPRACNPLNLHGSTLKAKPLFFWSQMASLRRVCIFRPATVLRGHIW